MFRDCIICGKKMKVYPYQLKLGKGKCCGWECAKVSISKTLTGMKQSKKTKERRSEKLKGYVWPDGTYDNRSGKNSYLWKGGKTKYSRLLQSKMAWKKWRKKVFERDDYTCKSCGAKSGKDYDGTIYIEPHHIFPILELIKYNLIKHIFNVNNGITLCRKCHILTIRRTKLCAQNG